MQPCQITGTLRAPSGAALPGATVRFLPGPVGVTFGGGVTAAFPVSAEADQDGEITVALLPGTYTMRVTVEVDGRPRESAAQLIDVPAADAAALEDVVVWLPTPQSVMDAAASAQVARREADRALTARAQFVTPEQFGAVGDGTTNDTAAIQAMFTASRMTARPWRMGGRYNLGDGSVICYTSGDGSGAELITTANGQSAQTLDIAPAPGDEPTADAALALAFSALTPLAKGRARIAELGPWAGYSVRIFSATPHRVGTTSDLRHEIVFEVLDSDGNIWPPLPYHVPSLSYSAEKQPLRAWVAVHAPTIRLASGTTNRVGVARVSRCRVDVLGGTIINETTGQPNTGWSTNFSSSVRWWATHVSGLKRTNTQYGWNLAGATFELHGCSEDWCRRGVDSTHGADIKLFGGRFPDGVGAHWAWGMSIDGAALGVNASNDVPVRFGGADLAVRNCQLHTRRTLIQSRTDNPMLAGAVIFTGNRATIDMNGLSDRVDANILRIAGPTSSHEAGGPMLLPSLVDLRGNDLQVLGAASNTRVNGVLQANLGNLADGVEVAGRIFSDGLAITYDDHSALLRFELAKHPNFSGDGWALDVRNAPRLAIWAGAHSGAGGPEARLDVWGENIGDLNLRPDFGGMRYARIDAQTVTQSPAFGLHERIGDEDWAFGPVIVTRDYSQSVTGRDFNNAVGTQFFGNSSNASGSVPANVPGTGLHCWGGWSHEISSTRAVQMAARVEIGTTTPRLAVRTKSGDWRPWQWVMHDGIELPTSAPDAPGRFWRDSANGNVIKQTPPA